MAAVVTLLHIPKTEQNTISVPIPRITGIVNYGEVPLIPGDCYSIALDGYSGEAICTWRGE